MKKLILLTFVFFCLNLKAQIFVNPKSGGLDSTKVPLGGTANGKPITNTLEYRGANGSTFFVDTVNGTYYIGAGNRKDLSLASNYSRLRFGKLGTMLLENNDGTVRNSISLNDPSLTLSNTDGTNSTQIQQNPDEIKYYCTDGVSTSTIDQKPTEIDFTANADASAPYLSSTFSLFGGQSEYFDVVNNNTGEYSFLFNTLTGLTVGTGTVVGPLYYGVNYNSQAYNKVIGTNYAGTCYPKGKNDILYAAKVVYGSGLSLSGGTLTATSTTSVTATSPLSVTSGTAIALNYGTGLSVSSGSLINSSPNQTVTLTGAGTTTVTGTYPTFTISGGAGGSNYSFITPLVATGTVVSIPSSNSATNGYLTSADWITFNGKQNALIGTGYAYQNAGITSYTTSIPNASLSNSTFTVNGTSMALGTSSVVTADANSLTGSILNSTVLTSSLTSVGTLTTGIIGNGTIINSPTMTLGSDATGDSYYRNATGKLTRLAVGTAGKFMIGGTNPAWSAYTLPTTIATGNILYASSTAGFTTSNKISLLISGGTTALSILGSTSSGIILGGMASMTYSTGAGLNILSSNGSDYVKLGGLTTDFSVNDTSIFAFQPMAFGSITSSAKPVTLVQVAGSNTSRASVRIESGVAPTTPIDGDIYNKTADHHLYAYLNGVETQLDNVNTPTVKNSTSLLSLTTATTVSTYTTVVSGMFEVAGFITVNAVSTNVINFQITFTDTHGLKTVTYQSMSSTGYNSATKSTFVAIAGSIITVSTILTTSIGTINYDVGATIIKVQ